MKKTVVFKKRVLLHCLFWLLAIAYSSLEDYNYYPHWQHNIQNNILNILCFLPIVYLNLYYIIPALLFRKKYVSYIVLSLVLITTGGFLISRLNHFVFSNDFYLSRYGYIILLRDELQIFIFTTAVKFIKHWYKSDSQIKELKTNNLQSELTLLKSQVNPHFFFNTLNSIYYLIGKAPAKGQEAVLKLSDLLSHQLYDNNRDKIELAKEIENLKNYLDLQEIRYADTITVNATFSSINGEMIAPMLLLPLVENAFKHGNTSASQGCFIDLAIEVSGHELHFKCNNSMRKHNPDKNQKGIGLHSVKRRLELLYPDKHHLDVTTTENIYSVDLRLQLNES